jgi:hypothetical protein
MKLPSVLILAAVSLSCLNPVHAADKQPAPAASGTAAPAPSGSLVSGVGTIELRLGTKQYLSKMGIAVVPAAAEAEIIQVRDDQWRLRASRADYNDGFHNLNLEAIGGTAVKNAIQTVKTDANGKYAIHGLPKGKYVLYAQYHSRYAIGYWLLPITINSDQDTQTVNFSNDNMREAYNLFKKD